MGSHTNQRISHVRRRSNHVYFTASSDRTGSGQGEASLPQLISSTALSTKRMHYTNLACPLFRCTSHWIISAKMRIQICRNSSCIQYLSPPLFLKNLKFALCIFKRCRSTLSSLRPQVQVLQNYCTMANYVTLYVSMTHGAGSDLSCKCCARFLKTADAIEEHRQVVIVVQLFQRADPDQRAR